MKVIFTFLLLSFTSLALFADEQKTPAAEVNKVKIDLEKVNKLVKELGSNEFKVRKKAKNELLALGFHAVSPLKEILAKTDDPEVSESIKEIIKTLTHRLHPEQLNAIQKEIAQFNFSFAKITGEDTTCEFFNYKNHLVIDIGNTRLVFEEQTMKYGTEKDRYDLDINLTGSRRSSGSSSSGNNVTIYSYDYDGSTGSFVICNQSFTISNYKLKVLDQELDLKSEVKQILFIDKDNKPVGIYEIK